MDFNLHMMYISLFAILLSLIAVGLSEGKPPWGADCLAVRALSCTTTQHRRICGCRNAHLVATVLALVDERT